MPEQKVKDLMDVGGGCQGIAIRLLEHKGYFFFYAYTMVCVQYMLKHGHATLQFIRMRRQEMQANAKSAAEEF